ncbi:MAG: hypothetical protein M0P35_00550 [Bacteroidales bacterium]|jgi:hypothetical protein|nr:hypothetical protein [Bacteroidales bacterium]
MNKGNIEIKLGSKIDFTALILNRTYNNAYRILNSDKHVKKFIDKYYLKLHDYRNKLIKEAQAELIDIYKKQMKTQSKELMAGLYVDPEMLK